jgi:PKHD-type hydroxylase
VYLKYKYWFFKKAVPIDICKQILITGRSKIQKAGTTLAKEDYKKRKCTISWLQDKWIYNIINPFIRSANQRAGWNFDFDWNESAQFTIYNKDEYYNWHIDQSAILRGGDDKNFKGKTRKLSLTLQLTDQSEYTGGDFQFMWIDNKKKNPLIIHTVDDAKEIGTVIVFPSFIYHRVLPITKGKRESLVNWSLGKPFK